MKVDREHKPGFYYVRFEGALIVAEYTNGAGCSEEYPHWHVPGSGDCHRDKDCDLLGGPLHFILPTEPLYYIQNVGYQGNCMKFWRPDGKGYTVDLDDAWKLTKAQAEDICRSRPTEDVPFLVSEIDAIARRHASIEVLRSARHATKVSHA